MTAITHQKYDEKRAIYRLLTEYLDSLNSDERKGFGLALAEAHMAKLSVKDLRDWRQRLEEKQPTWKGTA